MSNPTPYLDLIDISETQRHALVIWTYSVFGLPGAPPADDLPHPDPLPRAAYGLSFSRDECAHLDRGKRLPGRYQQHEETAGWFALYQALLLAPLACTLHIVIPNSTIIASMLRCKVQPVEGSTIGGPVAGPATYRELVQGPHGALVKKIFDQLTKREKEGWRISVHLGGPDDHRRPVSHAVWAYHLATDALNLMDEDTILKCEDIYDDHPSDLGWSDDDEDAHDEEEQVEPEQQQQQQVAQPNNGDGNGLPAGGLVPAAGQLPVGGPPPAVDLHAASSLNLAAAVLPNGPRRFLYSLPGGPLPGRGRLPGGPPGLPF